MPFRSIAPRRLCRQIGVLIKRGEFTAGARGIVAHDAHAARTAMQRHLNQASERFGKDWNARKS